MMINFTKQEVEYFNPLTYIKTYQERMLLLQDSTSRCLAMLSAIWSIKK